jgi:hypothetical protein
MTARRVVAGMWLSLVAATLVGYELREPLVLVGTWFGALLVLGASGSSVKARGDERLERPALYRAVAAIAFVVPVAGALLATVPGHDDIATLFAPYFAIVALLQYRALVATGPRPAPLAMCVAVLLWLPFCFPLMLGCKCYRYDAPPPSWTETAVPLALFTTLVLDGILCAVALLSFAHRDDELPEARITTARVCSP